MIDKELLLSNLAEFLKTETVIKYPEFGFNPVIDDFFSNKTQATYSQYLATDRRLANIFFDSVINFYLIRKDIVLFSASNQLINSPEFSKLKASSRCWLILKRKELLFNLSLRIRADYDKIFHLLIYLFNNPQYDSFDKSDKKLNAFRKRINVSIENIFPKNDLQIVEDLNNACRTAEAHHYGVDTDKVDEENSNVIPSMVAGYNLLNRIFAHAKLSLS